MTDQHLPGQLLSMPDFRFESTHAIDSLVERTQLTSEELLDLLKSGRGIWMNHPSRHWQNRSYILIFSERDLGFFIVIVACDPGTMNASIVTVLTQEQYENDRPAIFPSILNRALHASGASTATLRAYQAAHPTRRQLRSEEKWVQRQLERANRLSILIDYTTETGVFERQAVHNPPGFDASEVIADPTTIVDQDGFWEWFAVQPEVKKIPLQRVLGLKVVRAGGDPVDIKIGH